MNEKIEYAQAYGHGMLDGFTKGTEDNNYPLPNCVTPTRMDMNTVFFFIAKNWRINHEKNI